MFYGQTGRWQFLGANIQVLSCPTSIRYLEQTSRALGHIGLETEGKAVGNRAWSEL